MKVWLAANKQGDPGVIGIGGQLVLKKSLHLVGGDFQNKMWEYSQAACSSIGAVKKDEKEACPSVSYWFHDGEEVPEKYRKNCQQPPTCRFPQK